MALSHVKLLLSCGIQYEIGGAVVVKGEDPQKSVQSVVNHVFICVCWSPVIFPDALDSMSLATVTEVKLSHIKKKLL